MGGFSEIACAAAERRWWRWQTGEVEVLWSACLNPSETLQVLDSFLVQLTDKRDWRITIRLWRSDGSSSSGRWPFRTNVVFSIEPEAVAVALLSCFSVHSPLHWSYITLDCNLIEHLSNFRLQYYPSAAAAFWLSSYLMSSSAISSDFFSDFSSKFGVILVSAIVVCDSYLGVLHVVSEQWFWLQISGHQLDLVRV
jgi:hypothetical protein